MLYGVAEIILWPALGLICVIVLWRIIVKNTGLKLTALTPKHGPRGVANDFALATGVLALVVGVLGAPSMLVTYETCTGWVSPDSRSAVFMAILLAIVASLWFVWRARTQKAWLLVPFYILSIPVLFWAWLWHGFSLCGLG